jgi:ADP-heptose:LPS heptosyltransferase
MLGTPTVALFKESDARQWRPLGPSVSVIQNNKSGHELIERVLEAGKDVSHFEMVESLAT